MIGRKKLASDGKIVWPNESIRETNGEKSIIISKIFRYARNIFSQINTHENESVSCSFGILDHNLKKNVTNVDNRHIYERVRNTFLYNQKLLLILW